MEERVDHLAQEVGQAVLGTPHRNPEREASFRRAAAESIVLLKNEGMLPLDKNTCTSFFGRVQRDYFYVGYGSGGDVNAHHCISPMEAVAERGYCHNEPLAQTYAQWCAQNPIPKSDWGQWPAAYPEMPITEEAVRQAALASDQAVIFLGRAVGEAMDNRPEPGWYYLTAQERQLLGWVTTWFPHCAVVVDAGGILDLSWLEEYPVEALVYAFHGGMEAANALVDVLYGDAQPGGRLADTIARRYADYPSADHFGDPDFNEYREDIYVGYRYFETFAPEKVRFLFGFGLSYTTFSLQNRQTSPFSLQVTVTNTGHRTGRQVVQVYAQPPQGKLGKPVRNLIAFEKTAPLAPGQSQTLAFSWKPETLASFDDTGITGYPYAWVLEKGEYRFYAGEDVRNAPLAGCWTLEEDRLVEQCSSEAGPAQSFLRLRPEGENVPFGEGAVPVPVEENHRREEILTQLPQAIPFTGRREIQWEQVARGEATLEEFVAQLTPEELEALTRGEGRMDSSFGIEGNAGMFGGTLPSLRELGVPTVITTDGPAGLRLRHYTDLLPCATALACSWDRELVRTLGNSFGEEMVRMGSDVLLGPGMNIHRDPLCGRNFEYYSEDPRLSGEMASAMVAGIQSVPGRSACIKHFACNNQETNREHNDSRLSQRALREIYLKGFEICVKQAGPKVLMTSYNQINGVWGHYHSQLVTQILRQQWGYDGLVVTDWWMQPEQDPDFPNVYNDAYRIRAGVDVLMPGEGEHDTGKGDSSLLTSLGKENGITLGEIQRSAMQVLKFCLRQKLG